MCWGRGSGRFCQCDGQILTYRSEMQLSCWQHLKGNKPASACSTQHSGLQDTSRLHSQLITNTPHLYWFSVLFFPSLMKSFMSHCESNTHRQQQIHETWKNYNSVQLVSANPTWIPTCSVSGSLKKCSPVLTITSPAAVEGIRIKVATLRPQMWVWHLKGVQRLLSLTAAQNKTSSLTYYQTLPQSFRTNSETLFCYSSNVMVIKYQSCSWEKMMMTMFCLFGSIFLLLLFLLIEDGIMTASN